MNRRSFFAMVGAAFGLRGAARGEKFKPPNPFGDLRKCAEGGMPIALDLWRSEPLWPLPRLGDYYLGENAGPLLRRGR